MKKDGKTHLGSHSDHEFWTCAFCQQTVLVTKDGLRLPPGYFETCLLPEHMVENDCIARRNPERARRLLLGRE
jgi:hypothetical protein